MTEPLFLEEIDEKGIARITLTRSEVHNAFNDDLILSLRRSLGSLESDDRVRVLVLASRGRSFSAGADLNWMKRSAEYSEAENLADARNLAELMMVLDRFAKPTLALVQGPAYGGGVGLIACCDIALAAESARFALTEVRLGIVPAVISPYIVAAMGERQARRYALSAEPILAPQAAQLGLVHEAVPDEQLEVRGQHVIDQLLKGGPEAQQAIKALLCRQRGRPLDESLIEETAKSIAEVRSTDEAKEGLTAFFEKRSPAWMEE